MTLRIELSADIVNFACDKYTQSNGSVPNNIPKGPRELRMKEGMRSALLTDLLTCQINKRLYFI